MTIEALAVCLLLNAEFSQQVPFHEFSVTRFHADIIEKKGRARVDNAYIGASRRIAVMDAEAKAAALSDCERDFSTLLVSD